MRSLRTVYSAIKSEAFSNRSGGIEGRPTSLYICSNSGESSLSATSASALINLIGWLAGTLFLGFTKVSIVVCGRSKPRILLLLLNPASLIQLYRCQTSGRSNRRGISQHSANGGPRQLRGDCAGEPDCCTPGDASVTAGSYSWLSHTNKCRCPESE